MQMNKSESPVTWVHFTNKRSKAKNISRILFIYSSKTGNIKLYYFEDTQIGNKTFIFKKGNNYTVEFSVQKK